MILNYYAQCIKLKKNNTKTNTPSGGQYSGSPSPAAPWCAASSQCRGSTPPRSA